MDESKFGIVTVNFFGSKQIGLFLSSLSEAGVAAPVVLVDNSIDGIEAEKLNKIAKNTTYIGEVFVVVSTSNKGYMGGLNSGLEFLKLRFDSCRFDWFMLCNYDLEFDKNFGEMLHTSLVRADVSCGCISPEIVDENTGNMLNPFLLSRPSKRTINFLRFQYSSYLVFLAVELIKNIMSVVRDNKYGRSRNIVDGRQVYATHGALFIIRSDLVSTPIDCGYFMYAEEVTIAEICANNRKSIVLDSGLKVIHKSHESTGSIFSYKTFIRKNYAIKYVNTKYSFD